MSHSHDHEPGPSAATPGQGSYRAREGERGRLRVALGLTAGFVAVEVVGGILSGSLALLADAGHMATDAGALALSIWAMRLAALPPSPERTYGWVRAEILAALVNGAAVLGMAGWIAWEAWERLHSPAEVDGPMMLVVAVMGFGVNAGAALLLHRHSAENLNVRGAYLHVLGDLLGSVATVVAGIVIMATGWTPADPLISLVIGVLILAAAWRLIRDATDVLLEAAPRHVDVSVLQSDLDSIEGLFEVHDLHVWTLTSGFVALSGHGIVEDPVDQGRILEAIREVARKWRIEHVTFQLEPRPLYPLRGA